MNINHNILVRYFLGQCSENEKESIRQWLESSEANKKEFVRQRIRFDASLMAGEGKEERVIFEKRIHQNKIFSYLKIAAVIVILLGCSFLFQLYLSEPQHVVMQNISVPAGSRSSLTLSDGSLVWLNSNTTFIYPNIFPDECRMVELNGEGYFEVKADKKKTFIIKTDKYLVEVLGTTFNLKAYANEDAFKLSLYSGKVRLFKAGEESEELLLNPGEAAELIDNRLEVTSAGSYSYRWKDGLLVLEGQSFKDIMHLFEKYFDVEIVITNQKVMDLEYEGKLRIVDGIDHALRVLQNDFRFTFKRDVETNIIYIQ